MEHESDQEGSKIDKSCVVPIESRDDGYVVMVDGVPYATFVDKNHAVEAMDRWKILSESLKHANLEVKVYRDGRMLPWVRDI